MEYAQDRVVPPNNPQQLAVPGARIDLESAAQEASVTVRWSPGRCEIDIRGRVTRRVIDHVRDLLRGAGKPGERLVVRVDGAEASRELTGALISGWRRHGRAAELAVLGVKGEARVAPVGQRPM